MFVRSRLQAAPAVIAATPSSTAAATDCGSEYGTAIGAGLSEHGTGASRSPGRHGRHGPRPVRRPAGRVGRRLRAAALAWLYVYVLAVPGVLLAGAPAAAASNPVTWSSPVTADPVGGEQLLGVSCVSDSLCVAGDSVGNVLASTDPTGGASAWTVAKADYTALDGVSCPSVSLCVAVDGAGNVLTSTDPTGGAGAWTVTNVDGTTSLGGVSCPSVSLCVAVDGAGNVLTSTDPTGGAGAWAVAKADSPPVGFNVLNGVSCPSVSLCVAVDDVGNMVTSTDPTGGASAWSVTNVDSNSVNGVSCPTTTLCAAVDNGGNVLASTDPTGGASAWAVTNVDSSNGMTGVSCPSVSLCVAVDAYGNVLTSTEPTGGASTWTATRVASSPILHAVSCASTHFCVVVGSGGNLILGASETSGVGFSASPATQLTASGWSVNFTTSPSGALASGSGTITLTGPTGTVFPTAAGDYWVNGAAVTSIVSGGGTDSVTLTTPVAVAGSASVTVVATGVTNPAAGNDPGSDFAVSTSSDVISVHPGTGVDFTYAPDGSGTLAVSPTGTPASSTGNTLTFTYTAATGGTSGGEVAITVPSGWSTPSTTSTALGYTAASAGTVSVSGSTIEVTGVTLSGGGALTVTYGDTTGGGSGATAPNTTGTSSFTAQEASTGTGTLTTLSSPPSLTLGTALPLAMTTSSLPSGAFGAFYSDALAASGGVTPYSWTASGLPSGLSVTVSGSTYAITGVPEETASSSVTVTVQDATGASVSKTLPLTIGKGTPRVFLASGSNPSVPGQTVTYTASVGLGPVAPTGTVAFEDNGTPITGCGSQSLTTETANVGFARPNLLEGVATCAVTYASTGSHSITAVYSGDGNYLGSTSGTLSQVVSYPANSVVLVATPGSLPVNGSGTVQGTVYGSNGAVAGAQVTLSLSRGDGEAAGTLGSGTLTADGSGAFSTGFTAPPDSGTVTVTASVYGSVYTGQTVVIVTPGGVTVQGTDAASSTGGCNTVTAITGYTSETGCGAGTFAVAQYGTNNPAGTTSAVGGAAEGYFDAAVSADNTLSSATIQECNAQSGDLLEWWDPITSVWQDVSPAATLSGNCLSFTANGSSSPSLSQLYGTVFAVVAPQTVSYNSGGGGVATIGPEVFGVSPTSGPASGGTSVTISGSGFIDATGVAFGGTAAQSYTVQSDSEIVAVSPAGTGTVDIAVTTSSGVSTPDSADRFTYTAPAPTPPSTTVTFSDVPSSFWAYADIETLAQKQIINGFPNGTFQPNGDVTRAQFVKMLVLTLGLKPGSGTTPFTDVTPSAWYAPCVSAAVQAGIVDGVSATSFDPNGTLTREQMAVLLARALKLSNSATLRFTDDAMIDAWARAGVAESVAAGYIDGFPNGTFQPLGTATRAQAAKVLAMALKHMSS